MSRRRIVNFVVAVLLLVELFPLQLFRGEGQVVKALAPQSSLPFCGFVELTDSPQKARDDCAAQFTITGGVPHEGLGRPLISYVSNPNQRIAHLCEMPSYTSSFRPMPPEGWPTKPPTAPNLSVAECLANKSLTVIIRNNLGPCNSPVTIPCIEDLQMRSVAGDWFSGTHVGEPNRSPIIELLTPKWGPFPELETGVQRLGNYYTFPGLDPTQLYEVTPTMVRRVVEGILRNPSSLDVSIRGVKLLTGKKKLRPSPPSYRLSSEEWVAGEIDCKLSSDETCWQYTPTPIDNQFRLVLRLPVQPNGWIAGRLFQAGVKFEQLDGVTVQPYRVTLMGSPVPTPRIMRHYWSDVPEEKHDCELIRNVLIKFSPSFNDGCFTRPGYGSQIRPHNPSMFVDLLTADRKFDKATDIVTEWEVRMTFIEVPRPSAPCDTGGFLGLVSSNALTHSQMPIFNPSGSLDYVVAGPHFLPDNSVSTGYYTAVIAREYVECLWKKIYLIKKTMSPIFQASLSVVEQDGKSSTAVTVVGMDKNFIQLSASGFTYSQKTIRITLSDKTTSPRKSSRGIICVKGKKTLQLTGTKSCPTSYRLKK